MDFNLSEEQALIQSMVREFAESKIAPVANENDREHRFPKDLVKQMGELNLFGLGIDEEYGGTGVDTLSAALAYEELGRVDAGVATIVSVHAMGQKPLAYFGTEEQKKKFLPETCSGERIACFCLTEPNAGTDASAQATRAVKDGNDWVINGSKCFITSGSEGGTYLIFCMTDPEKGLKGISCFVTNRETPGLKIGQLEDKLGICCSATAELIFDNLRVPAENMVGKEGDGFKIAMRCLDSGRVGVAALAVGIAQGSLDHAVAYIKERKQFGKPIAANQGIQWMVAEMAAKVEAARLATYKAALCNDVPGRHNKESAIAKLLAARAAVDVARDSIQLHGGIGYMKGHDVERFFRDAKITEIYEGTNEVMKMVISASVLA